MTFNAALANLCDNAGVTIFCAAVLTAKGTMQLALPLEFRRLCLEEAFRDAFVKSIARCLEQLVVTPMDDLNIQRLHGQNGGSST